MDWWNTQVAERTYRGVGSMRGWVGLTESRRRPLVPASQRSGFSNLQYDLSHAVAPADGWIVWRGSADGRGLWVRYPLVLLPTLLLPGLWVLLHWRRRRLHRRQRLGLCIQCGYDLRAHHPGQKCPECGLAVPANLQTNPLQ